MSKPTIPVTVFCGYLGAGKTTLLNSILHNRSGLKVAVIVNDMSEINVDAEMIKKGSTLSRTEERLVELSNGCICCTLRDDLLDELGKLTENGQFDYILIESTGVGEPIPIAQTIMLGETTTGVLLSTRCHVDAMVTVLDAHRLLTEFNLGKTLVDFSHEGDRDGEDIAQLLVEQIEFCDILILNKTDLVSEEELAQIESFVKILQPRAKLIKTTYSQVPFQEILHTNLFDFEAAVEDVGWLNELEKDYHVPETEEYGIGSYVYRSKVPFDSEKIERIMHDWPANITRAKGLMWLANDSDNAYDFSQAGRSIYLSDYGPWLAKSDVATIIDYLTDHPEAKAYWDECVGDRLTELVLIGTTLDPTALKALLDSALITTEALQDLMPSLKVPKL